jgi:hypothetical protein
MSLPRRPLREVRVGTAIALVLFGEERVCRVVGCLGAWVIVVYDHGKPPPQGGPQLQRLALPGETPARLLLS